MRNTIQFLFITLFMLGGNIVCSQPKIQFGYDNAGNRELRQFVNVTQMNSLDSLPESIIKQHEEIVFDDEVFSAVKVYPNPADYRVNIEFSGAPDEDLLLMLYDQQGRLMVTETFQAYKHIVDVKNFAPGLYFILLKYNEKTSTFRIIKK
jgi:hypothetical protein